MIKKKIAEIIEGHAEEIIKIGEQISKHPELGFCENKTSQLVQDKFKELGLTFTKDIVFTGVRADLHGRENNCHVAYFAELDAITCPEHLMADPDTGAAHACGHNVQTAIFLGVAQALVEADVASQLGGDIAFIAVPAEELGQIEYRNSLKSKGELSFLTGKQEMIAKGILDDIDLSFMVHMQVPKEQGKLVTVGCTTNGAIAKYTNYKGVAAHASTGPHLGINALNAAMLGMQGINAQRETFRNEDQIFVHSIITKGGTLVNSVPDDVKLETFVRANNPDAMLLTCEKVDRALRAGADAIGASVKIENIPGYMPMIHYKTFDNVFKENAAEIFGENLVGDAPHINGSTDMGDISQIMPTTHPFVHVVKGKMHGVDFEITDTYNAYVQTAKVVAWTLVDLLIDGAAKGLEVKRNSKPPISKLQWLEKWQELLGGYK